jgi:hypothetical protein
MTTINRDVKISHIVAISALSIFLNDRLNKIVTGGPGSEESKTKYVDCVYCSNTRPAHYDYQSHDPNPMIKLVCDLDDANHMMCKNCYDKMLADSLKLYNVYKKLENSKGDAYKSALKEYRIIKDQPDNDMLFPNLVEMKSSIDEKGKSIKCPMCRSNVTKFKYIIDADIMNKVFEADDFVDVEPINKDVGNDIVYYSNRAWSCPQCTFVNKPTGDRTSANCKVCDYQVVFDGEFIYKSSIDITLPDEEVWGNDDSAWDDDVEEKKN